MKPERRDRTVKYLIDMIRQLDDRKLCLVYVFALHLFR